MRCAAGRLSGGLPAAVREYIIPTYIFDFFESGSRKADALGIVFDGSARDIASRGETSQESTARITNSTLSKKRLHGNASASVPRNPHTDWYHGTIGRRSQDDRRQTERTKKVMWPTVAGRPPADRENEKGNAEVCLADGRRTTAGRQRKRKRKCDLGLESKMTLPTGGGDSSCLLDEIASAFPRSLANFSYVDTSSSCLGGARRTAAMWQRPFLHWLRAPLFAE